MGKIGLIIRREYLSRVQKRSFLVMTFLGPVLMGGLLTLGIYLGMNDERMHRVLVVDLTPTVINDSTGTKALFEGRLRDNSQVRFFYSNEALTNPEFEETDYTDMLVIRPDIVTYPEAELVSRELPSLKVRSYLKAETERIIEIEKLKLNNLTEEQFASIRTDVDLVTIDSEEGTRSYKQEQAFVGFAFAVIIYFFIFLYGVQVMRGVMEEKTNRIVEVIISSVKPFELMMGKIVGIALVGLTQFLLWVALTSTILTLAQGSLFPDMQNAATMAESGAQMSEEVAREQGDKRADIEVNNAIGELVFFRINWPLMLGMFLFFFLGGYLLYASLLAAIGSAVDQESDSQQFMLPITIPLVFGFIVSEFALTNPEGPAVFWCSLIPLTSPIVMMVRVAMGFDSGNIWQLYLSMALLVLGFLGAVWLAGRIYRIGILMYGKKVNFKELGKWLTYK